MAAGATYKQCGCRDNTGRRLGKKCPRLRRADGAWSHGHGRWYYQLELPSRPDGTRRTPLRRGGFGSQKDAQRELDRARELLAIPPEGDQDARRRIADLITRCVKADGCLPEPGMVRRLARIGRELDQPPLTGEWLEEWLAAAKNLRPGTVRSYAAHIRLYYQPHIGHIRIDRLRVADVASVFDAIDEASEAIAEARASGDLDRSVSVKGGRVVGAATKQRIRATLRSAITTYMKQHPGVLDINPAGLVELPLAAGRGRWYGLPSAPAPGSTTSRPGSAPPVPPADG